MSVILPADHQPKFGAAGKTVFERTYSRPKSDGSKESWSDTVIRVILGNLSLVYGQDITLWPEEIKNEAQELYDYIYDFKVIPAGRHLWASGVKGRQYLFNCHVSGWGEKLSDHFEFTFMRLMEGGGVGANYSNDLIEKYGPPKRELRLHVVCDDSHKDIEKFQSSLSEEYSPEWTGAFRIEDSREGWASAVIDLIDTFYAEDVMHKDRVFDVSLVRPEGSKLKQFGGTASGPAPLVGLLQKIVETLNYVYLTGGSVRSLDAMDIDHAIGECVVAGGVRRSARMSMVKWDDPDIFKFLECKSDFTKHWTTNISVEIDDEFISYINQDATVRGDTERIDQARKVHKAVVAGMLANGEPGYWNGSLNNKGERQVIRCSNPCGEIGLEEFENCNLGHVNLEAFAPQVRDGWADSDGMKRAHELVTRFLIRATFGDVNDPKQAAVLASNRRIGVGHLGVQGYLNRSGRRYSEAPKGSFNVLLSRMKQTVREEARRYSLELGIPEPIKTTTVAPTGSIAKMPGATEGIHPVYAKYFLRRIRFSKLRPEEVVQVELARAQGRKVVDDIYAANTSVVEYPTVERLVQDVIDLGLPESIVESVDEISLTDMLAFQEMYQTYWADNAVSMTVNFPEGQYGNGYVERILAKFLPNLKGTTLMPDGTRPLAPYERLTREEFEILSTNGWEIDSSLDDSCQKGSCPIK